MLTEIFFSKRSHQKLQKTYLQFFHITHTFFAIFESVSESAKSPFTKFNVHITSHSKASDLFLGPESTHEKHCILSKNEKYKKFSFSLELFKNFKKGYKKGYWSALDLHEVQDFSIKPRKMQ